MFVSVIINWFIAFFITAIFGGIILKAGIMIYAIFEKYDRINPVIVNMSNIFKTLILILWYVLVMEDFTCYKGIKYFFKSTAFKISAILGTALKKRM